MIEIGNARASELCFVCEHFIWNERFGCLAHIYKPLVTLMVYHFRSSPTY